MPFPPEKAKKKRRKVKKTVNPPNANPVRQPAVPASVTLELPSPPGISKVGRRVPFPRHIENLIASFRGMPADRSRSQPRETLPIGKLIPDLLEKHRIGLPTREDTIAQNWPGIVGPANAGFVHLMKIERNRRVYVAVTNPIVRQELFFHRKLILDRIRALPGCKDLRELVLRAG